MVTLPTLSDTSTWTDTDLEALRTALYSEQERRRVLRDNPVLIDQMNTQVLKAIGRSDGVAWVQPTGAHDAYPKNWNVVKDGYSWTSLISGNVWPPSDSNSAMWKKGSAATPATPAAAPAWNPNSKSYKVGDRVSYNSKNYVCGQAHTSNSGWTPEAAVSLWIKE